ncbi:Suf-domain-containing protein [Piedraia hortae CBS 480.64]|uniref:mRNA 3'-end-processing protein RNA14 n=1 Tax=Piedraia hortae CBS 480.64 TaxID=1314780 RepID=A0A6A7CCL2_9PEZI|nr:Suf-domain-containing protein [Piedraia hortae CBS 480.64]
MAAYNPAAIIQYDVDVAQQSAFHMTMPEAGDDEDYEPASFAHNAEQSSAPKMTAGFIMNDSDVEDQDTEPASPLQAGRAGAVQDISIASEPAQLPGAASDAASTDHSFSALPVDSASRALPDLTVRQESKDPAVHQESNDPVVRQESKEPSHALAPDSHPHPVQPDEVNAHIDTELSVATQRLPHDKVGRLEDRIKDDPKGDTAAWLELLAHYKDKDQPDKMKAVFERMLEVFPIAPMLWIKYARTLSNNRQQVEAVFTRALPQVPDVELWSLYLDHVRRIFPIISDPTNQSRGVVLRAFEAVLNTVGIDPDAGTLWREYIDFHKSARGTVGGERWEDLQKADLIRAAYQRAIRVPTSELIRLWKDYDAFEMSLNKANGRKALNEQSPHYVQAKTARNQQEEIVKGINRGSLPVLPPLHGCEGDEAFQTQVKLWERWIEWERGDPLVLQDDELALYRQRVLYVYKQACMHLRFYPAIWVEAAQWCFDEAAKDVRGDELTAQGESFLDSGISANPESVLLALKKADRIEQGLAPNSTNQIAIDNGEKLNVPFEFCHKALYALRDKLAEREKQALQEVEDHAAKLSPEEDTEEITRGNNDDEDAPRAKTKEEKLEAEKTSVRDAYKTRAETIRRLISQVWIAKMRAFARVQGQGVPGRPLKGARGVFAESRPRGQLTRDVYIAAALIERYCFKDTATCNKIFERGLKLFPTDEVFALEYMQHLVHSYDITNARVVFEKTMAKIKDSPLDEEQRRAKSRPLLGFMHRYEAEYGDLLQMQQLEKRMRDMFPDEPELLRFCHRFRSETFDVILDEVAISPQQERTKPTVAIAAEPMAETAPEGKLQLGPNGPYIASPKRRLEEDEEESGRSRKFLRTDSPPLKGAAGRKIANSGGATTSTGGGTLITNAGSSGSAFITKSYIPAGAPQPVPAPPLPPRLPQEVMLFLQMLPSARDYHSRQFDAQRMVGLMRDIDVERLRSAMPVMGKMSAQQFSQMYLGRHGN